MTVLKACLVLLCAPIPLPAQSIAPCTPDADTLHLWHLDESAVPVYDSMNGELPLLALLGGASLGNAALPGFGSSLDTHAGGSTGALLLAASSLANGAADDVPFSHADPATGAFTYEAVIRFDTTHDPLAQPSAPARQMQILSMENDTPDNRVFQFRYEGRTDTGDPKLVFINIGSSVTVISATVPVSGEDAVNSTNWFHVAVTYDGNAGAAGNTKLYWTRLTPATTQAGLLGSGSMPNDLLATAADFAIGNEARDAVGGSTDGFPGRIDEVRISSIAREADGMIPSNEDSDLDSLGDAWENTHFGNLDEDAGGDPDLDGADNRTEYLNGTDPTEATFAPYGGDSSTLHLWHLDDVARPVLDSAGTPDNLPLEGLLNGAALQAEGPSGLGTALDTNPGGILLAAAALADGPADNVPFSFADPASGAFTYEAVIRFDAGYDPATATDGRKMQIISLEGDDSDGSRIFQFRIYSGTGTPDPRLGFVNLRSGGTQILELPLPLTGEEAVNNHDWFHVAVIYDGNESTADNLKFYWTRLRGGLEQATLLGSRSLAADLPADSGDFAIGNEGRATEGTGEGFPGRIDEVRISGSARSATTMLPVYYDSDTDGLPDWWERLHFGNLVPSGDDNTDWDVFTHREEYANGTDPTVTDGSDLDQDGIPDPWELAWFGNLDQDEATDYDRDGSSELQEYGDGSDPTNPNSIAGDLDGDSLPDAWERLHFTGLIDTSAYEDPDGDGYSNVAERTGGTDPNDPFDRPSWKAPRVALLRDAVVTTDACLMPTGSTFGREINGVSFQAEILLSWDGYQYTAWYDTVDTVETIWLARRSIAGTSVGPWEKYRTGSEFTTGDEDSWDAHNTISLGVAPDGTLHMMFDHHGHNLRYRGSVAGLCTTDKAAWGTIDMMGPEQDWLDAPGNTITGLTYPMFFNRPGGELLVSYRVGGHLAGDHYLHEYDDESGSWSPRWKVTSKAGTFTGLLFNGYGSSTSRNPYENGWDFGPDGTLHHTWTCREQTGASNHDIHYAYSNDGGIVWRNNEGEVIADTSLGQAITVNSPGVVIKVIDSRQLLINQQTQCVDNDGRVHVLMWHRRTEPGFEYQSGDGKFFGPDDVAYHHYFRDPLTGKWAQRRIPPDVYAVGSRPKIGYDSSGNVYAVFTSTHPDSGNYGLVVASASRKSQYSDWEIVQVADLDFEGEPLLDQIRLLADGILSVFIQENGTASGAAIQTPLHVFDFVVDVPEPASGFRASIRAVGEDIVVSVRADQSADYQLQKNPDLAEDGWIDTGLAVPGVEGLLALPDPSGILQKNAFYRVVKEP